MSPVEFNNDIIIAPSDIHPFFFNFFFAVYAKKGKVKQVTSTPFLKVLLYTERNHRRTLKFNFPNGSTFRQEMEPFGLGKKKETVALKR